MQHPRGFQSTAVGLGHLLDLLTSPTHPCFVSVENWEVGMG